ncbi:MAG: M67 family metallopeptidase [Acidobacteria bacterium]|nr:M67 family metallopeptidase [Acidobacteriota bacterium]
MPIELPRSELLQIQQHGSETYPHECCGVILGKQERGRSLITEVIPIKNSREGDPPAAAPSASPEILDLLREAYRLLQSTEPKNDAIFDWLERADPVLNSARNRFRIMPEDLLNVDREAREKGVDILGVYHSHPDHPARPSEYDRQHLLCPWYTTYLILAVENGAPRELTGWTASEDGTNFVPSEVVVADEVPASRDAEHNKGVS